MFDAQLGLWLLRAYRNWAADAPDEVTTININCAATEPDRYERDRAWVREWFDALAPYSTGGVYVNFTGEEGSARVRAAYGEAKYRRLAAVKARYDPDNVLHVNQNVQPIASGDAVGA
jgi:FAD/FMN-containing dehydrogenase